MKILLRSLAPFLAKGALDASPIDTYECLCSVLLYSSANSPSETPSNDANSFPPFKMVDSTIMHNIVQQLDALDQGLDEEGLPSLLCLNYSHILSAPSALVGALTKALCCKLGLNEYHEKTFTYFSYQSIDAGV